MHSPSLTRRELHAALDGVEGFLDLDEAELLCALAMRVAAGCIVEVGSYRGRSTVALALGAAAAGESPVFAIDPHEPFTGVLGGQFGPEDRAAFFRNMLASGRYANVRLVNLGSEVVTAGWRQPVGLLWIDGDHRYEGVRADFSAWEPHLLATAHVAFDDATDPRIGPHRLIGELIADGVWRTVHTVGKVVVLARGTAHS